MSNNKRQLEDIKAALKVWPPQAADMRMEHLQQTAPPLTSAAGSDVLEQTGLVLAVGADNVRTNEHGRALANAIRQGLFAVSMCQVGLQCHEHF